MSFSLFSESPNMVYCDTTTIIKYAALEFSDINPLGLVFDTDTMVDEQEERENCADDVI